jgi:hypothetical protein
MPRLGWLSVALIALCAVRPAIARAQTSVGSLCTWEYSTALANCAAFPDVAGKDVFIVTGISTKNGAQFIQLYDAAAAPPSGSPLWQTSVNNTSYGQKWAPEAIHVTNGALICNSTNADPTQYTAGASDTTFWSLLSLKAA